MRKLSSNVEPEDYEGEELVVTSIKIPLELKRKLQRLARKNRRTMTAQITYELERSDAVNKNST